MARLRGKGLGTGLALGTAAVVPVRDGFPMAPEIPTRIGALMAARRLSETPEIVLVAENYRDALALVHVVNWAKVIGIVAGFADQDAPVPPIPAVVNVPYLLEEITDDMLLLVDADRGTILSDPDPVAVAQYQATFLNLAPRRRYYLGGAHIPAQTLDGRTVQTVRQTDVQGVSEALEEGPDAVYMEPPSAFDDAIQRGTLAEILTDAESVLVWTPRSDDAVQRDTLEVLLEEAAGKSLFLEYNSASPLQPFAEAAGRAELTLVVGPDCVERPEDFPGIIAQIVKDLQRCEAACIEDDILCGQPHIAVSLAYTDSRLPQETAELEALIESLEALGATRIVFYGLTLEKERLAQFERLVAIATTHLMPVYFQMRELTVPDAELEKTIRLLVGAGVTGLFMAAPGMVTTVKESVRSLRYSECREELFEYLGETEERA
jgi:hypothetical protein